MKDYGSDIYAEPEDVDVDTLANLGPLRRLAGVWTGEHGVDVHPSAEGSESQGFVERIELQPIDPQTNGPQLFYGLRYHQHVLRPGIPETFHDQVGYWLWEPATGTVIQSLTIPRGQTALAMGNTTADASIFELVAHRGSTEYGICSNPFLETAFQTVAYRIKVTIQDDDHWSYDQTTTLLLKGSERFEHTDHSRLRRVAPPSPNPLKRRPSGEA